MDNKFNKGDRVRIINDFNWWADMEGEVISVGFREPSGYNYIVKMTDRTSQPEFYENELMKLNYQHNNR